MDRDRVNEAIFLVAEGDTAGLDIIYGEVGGRMLSIALSIVKNRQAAEDVVQDSFIKIAKYAKRFREEVNGYGWIAKIVYNTALNKLKYEKRRTGAPLDEFPFLADDKGGDNERFAVAEAVKKLPTDERKVIYFKYYLDFTVRETAKSIGKSKSATQRLISSAEARLKILLE